jgi:nucleoside phosphorylase
LKILVTFAVDAEFAPWRARHEFNTVRREKAELHEAAIGGAQVTVLLTGVGPRVSRKNVTEAFVGGVFERQSFGVCISSGLAGALRDKWKIGDVLAPRCVQSDSPQSREMAGLQFAPEPEYVKIAQNSGAHVVERFLTSDRMILSAAEKTSLGAEADAVEMESYGILSEASAWGARGVCVRAVGDLAGEDLPINFSRTIDEEGDVSYLRVLGEVAKNPLAVPGLVRFGKQSRSAAESLANFLDRYVATLAAGAGPNSASDAVAVRSR